MKRLIVHILFFCIMMTAGAKDTITYDIHSGLSHWVVSDILQDKQGFLWFSTWNGLNRYDGYEFKQIKTRPGDGTHIQSEVIRGIDLDDDGNIICYTDNDRFMLDTKEYRLTDMVPDDYKHNTKTLINNTLTDKDGNQWILNRYGITKISPNHHPAQVVSGTEDIQARAFLKDSKKRWWLATKEDESVRIFNSRNELIGYIGTDGNIHKGQATFGYRPYCIIQTASGDIWMGCKPGALLRLREKSDGTFEIKKIMCDGLTCDIIYHLTEDKEGRLWIATFGDGLQCIVNPRSEYPSCVNFLDNKLFEKGKEKVRRLLITDKGHIICATTRGLITMVVNGNDIKASRFRRLTRNGKDEGSLCNNATTDVVSDGKGNIIIATENSGIDMIAEKDIMSDKPVFKHFNRANSSLTSDACLAITPKGNSKMLVVCTDRMMEFDPYNDSTTTYSTRFWGDACHFSEERPIQLFDGTWLFALEQGAFTATQHNLNTRGDKPVMVFTQLTINGKETNLGICTKDTVVMGVGERNFTISFAAIDYTDNTGIMYRSRMNGQAWSVASTDRSLAFYNMLPGHYSLEVQSTDRYGRWANNNRILVIIVTPEWHETLPARIGGWILIIAFITGVVYMVFYVRNLKRQRSELLEKYMSLLNAPSTAEKKYADENEAVLMPELSAEDSRFLERVRRYIEENIGNSDANINDMAAFAATSHSNLNRKLRSLVGITAAQLLIDARMQKARQILESNGNREKTNIADVAYRCGYSDPRYFSRCFKQKYHVSPSEFASEAKKPVLDN